MKKKILSGICAGALALTMLSGCSDKGMARYYGGKETINLEPGQKLELVTWKDDSLWILTRPAEDGEKPTIYTYEQDSAWGVFEGTVTIVEK